MTWQDERPKHGILLLSGHTCTCTCGTKIVLRGKEAEMTASKKYDALLDRHKMHKENQERKK